MGPCFIFLFLSASLPLLSLLVLFSPSSFPLSPSSPALCFRFLFSSPICPLPLLLLVSFLVCSPSAPWPLPRAGSWSLSWARCLWGCFSFTHQRSPPCCGCAP